MPLLMSLRSTLPGPPAAVRTALQPAGHAENGAVKLTWGTALGRPDAPSHAQVDADPYSLATPVDRRGAR